MTDLEQQAGGRPTVAITLGHNVTGGGSDLVIASTFVSALTAAGAVPIMVPPGVDDVAVRRIMAGVDGLLLPSGVDPHPGLFGEAVHPETVTDEAVDDLEIAAIAVAMQRKLPILGICRGSQILNVALGGSLIQHLSTAEQDHKPGGPLADAVHHIAIERGSRLHRLCDSESLKVNSFHHQAIARAADLLRVVARSADGVVEAVEAADPDRWLLGVQYHPEVLTEASHRALFRDFVEACAERRAEP